MKTSLFQEKPAHLTRWVLLPLRLFLAITFIYAGLQKLTDPQFFDPKARGYIGKQIIGFASGSPLHNLLIQVAVPHAHIFGLLVAYGEIAIGLGTLLGLLFRPAAFFGLLISFTFFLTATWRVFPYFYGADIVFVFCWLTLIISGPSNTGLPALDNVLLRRYLSPQQRKQFAPLLAVFLGVGEETPAPVIEANYGQTQAQGRSIPHNKRPSQQQSRYALALQQEKESRRNFLLGTITGGGGMLVLAWLWSTLHLFPGSADSTSTTTGTGSTAPGSTPVSGTVVAGSGTPIAQVNSLQNNSSVNFTIASNGDPGILVRLNNGQFVAYDATCTHAGCPVDYDPSSQMLVCPCHGATFDPSQNAAVTGGPAPTPLTKVPVHVDNTTGAIIVN